MLRTIALLALLLTLTLPTAAWADSGPALGGQPNAAEATFVHAIQAALGRRFATAAQAEHAGYVRFTNEDDTGSISYANRQWNSIDVHYPSQLWYDVHGRLLGADYSVYKTGATPPNKWGVRPGRWSEFDAHVHYVAVDPATGKKQYDLYVPADKWVAAGGNLAHPQAATLVKLGLVKSAKDVAIVFLFPTIWDLIVWVKPNPSGAFADKNPLVTPSTTH